MSKIVTDIDRLAEYAEATKCFGTLLRNALGEAGYSQADLASELRVSRNAVSAWVCGLAIPHPKTLARIVEALVGGADLF
jgi:RNA polymerase primary sigma factor